MPLGLSNAPSTFQKLIKNVFQETLDYLCIVHLDDILIYSYSTLKHLQQIEWVLSKLRSNSYFTNPSKCEFGPTKLKHLGYIILSGSFKPDDKKTEAISQLTFPTNV